MKDSQVDNDNEYIEILSILDKNGFSAIIETILDDENLQNTCGKLLLLCWCKAQNHDIDFFLAKQLSNGNKEYLVKFLLNLIKHPRINFLEFGKENQPSPLATYFREPFELNICYRNFYSNLLFHNDEQEKEYGKLNYKIFPIDIISIDGQTTSNSRSSLLSYVLIYKHQSPFVNTITKDDLPKDTCQINFLLPADERNLPHNLGFFKNLLLSKRKITPVEGLYIIKLYLYFASLGFTTEKLGEILELRVDFIHFQLKSIQLSQEIEKNPVTSENILSLTLSNNLSSTLSPSVSNSTSDQQQLQKEECYLFTPFISNLESGDNPLINMYGYTFTQDWRITSILLGLNPRQSVNKFVREETIEKVLEKLGFEIATAINNFEKNIVISHNIANVDLSSIFERLLPFGHFLIVSIFLDIIKDRDGQVKKYFNSFLHGTRPILIQPICQAILHHCLSCLFALHLAPFPISSLLSLYDLFKQYNYYVSSNVMNYIKNFNNIYPFDFVLGENLPFYNAIKNIKAEQPHSIEFTQKPNSNPFSLQEAIEFINSQYSPSFLDSHSPCIENSILIENSYNNDYQSCSSLFEEYNITDSNTFQNNRPVHLAINFEVSHTKKVIDVSALTQINSDRNFTILAAIGGDNICLSKCKYSSLSEDDFYEFVWKVHAPDPNLTKYHETIVFPTHLACWEYCINAGSTLLANGLIFRKNQNTQLFSTLFCPSGSINGPIEFFQIIPYNELFNFIENESIIKLLKLINQFLEKKLLSVSDHLQTLKNKGIPIQFEKEFCENPLVLEVKSKLAQAIGQNKEFDIKDADFPSNEISTALGNIKARKSVSRLLSNLIKKSWCHPLFEQSFQKSSEILSLFFDEDKSPETIKIGKYGIEFLMGSRLQNKYVAVPSRIDNPFILNKPLIYVFKHVKLNNQLSSWLSKGLCIINEDEKEEEEKYYNENVIIDLSEKNLDDFVVTLLQSPLPSQITNHLINLISKPGRFEQIKVTELSKIHKYIIHNLAEYLSSITDATYISSIMNMIVHIDEKEYHPDWDLLFDRAGQKYGIHVVDYMDDSKAYLKEFFGEYFTIINLNNNKIISNQQLWLSVLEHFEKGVLCIYFTGTNKYSDLFLKCCSEYTANNCWCLIYFEGLDTNFISPEQIDRLCIHKEKGNSKSSYSSSTLSKCHLEIQEDLIIDLDNLSFYISNFITNFEDKISLFLNNDQDILFSVGPPGIGKTYAVANAANNSANVTLIDGSSPEFIKKSIKEKFISLKLMEIDHRNNPARKILIVDEFHLMSLSQKTDVLTLSKQCNCKLILIANRYHYGDIAEINRIYFNNENFHKQEKQYLIECRGNFNNFLELIKSSIEDTRKQANALRFFKCFLEVSRIYFGEEVLSFRFFKKLRNIYLNKFNSPDFYNRIAACLKEKFPHLPSKFLDDYCSYFRIYYRKKFDDISKIFTDGKSKSLIEVLICAALLHVQDIELNTTSTNIITSYPELLTPTFLPCTFRYHPSVKLFNYFVLLVCSKLGKEMYPKLKDAFKNLFSSYMIVEVPFRFPQIHLEVLNKGIAYALTSNISDPYDLDYIVYMRQCGYAINTSSLKAWHENFLTNVLAIKKLLTTWPEAIKYMHKQNVKNLLYLGDVEIAKIIRDNTETRDFNDANSEYFMASWVVYCNCPEEFENGPSLYHLLLWAAQYSTNLNKTSKGIETFEKNLKLSLQKASLHFFEKTFKNDKLDAALYLLWSGVFARWACIDFSRKSSYLGWKIAIRLAAYDNYNPNWDNRIIQLHKIHKGIAPDGILAELWNSYPEYWEYLCNFPSNSIKLTFFCNIIKSANELSSSQLFSIVLRTHNLRLPDELVKIEYVKPFLTCYIPFVEEYPPRIEHTDFNVSSYSNFFWKIVEYYCDTLRLMKVASLKVHLDKYKRNVPPQDNTAIESEPVPVIWDRPTIEFK